MRLGIDLGTTRTVVAICDRGNYPVLRFTLEGGDAIDGVPTIVAARDGELRYGLDAVAVADDPSFELLRSFKRVLGEPGGHERMLTVGGRAHPAAELLVGFLGHLRDAILHRSNLPRKRKKKEQEQLTAVVATPANALGAQRFLTLEAFRKAGFVVSATLNEPSAAGFEYTHAHQQTITGKRAHVVVYDLGGGTFDASLVRVTELKHDAVVTAGVATLGGDDFDQVLLDLALAEADVDGAKIEAHARTRLLEICREAKERLHPNSKKLPLELPEVGDVSVSTAAYYAACEPLVERTIEAMLPVMNRLENSADPLEDIAGIYVVGGASALPVVGRMLRDRFGRRVHRSPYPSAATAVGLAIAADDEAGFELEDRFSRAFGVFRDNAGDVDFDVIFDRETALPKREERVTVERRYRVAHDLGHFRFLECTGVDRHGAPEGDLSLFVDVRFPFVPELQHEGTDLAKRAVHRLPSLGTTVCERYQLDAHGLVRLSLTDEATGYTRDFTLR
ncbi:MAG: Hsp70 family protein [Polyangiales bacterium]